MTKKISVVITAAGSSTRMKSADNKLFMDLNGKSVLQRTIESFIGIENIIELIIVAQSLYFDKINSFMVNYSINYKLIEGGKTREISAYNGIKAVSDDVEYVLCHDGARPLISKKIILKVLDELNSSDAVITGVKSKDTIKIVSEDGIVMATPDRKLLYNIQTPQAFKKDIISKGYDNYFKNNISVTDDSSIVELLNIPIKVVEGEYFNIKITTIEDIIFIREYIKESVDK